MKTKAFITVLIIFLLFSTGSSWYLLFKERKVSSRLEADIRYGYQTGFKITDYYKAKNGQLVARNAVLEFSNKEIRKGIAQDVLTELENLGIKPKYVTNYSETVVRHEKEIQTRLRDSTVFDTVPVRVFSYADRFYNIKGIEVGETLSMKIQSEDSITQVIYKGSRYNRKGKKVPGICFWLPRRLEQVISSNNPSSKITYSKTISVSK